MTGPANDFFCPACQKPAAALFNGVCGNCKATFDSRHTNPGNAKYHRTFVYRNWFRRFGLLDRANEWLRRNSYMGNWDGMGRYKYAWLHMPIREMGMTQAQARIAFSDIPGRPIEGLENLMAAAR